MIPPRLKLDNCFEFNSKIIKIKINLTGNNISISYQDFTHIRIIYRNFKIDYGIFYHGRILRECFY